jgi:hypothetical protein
MKCYQIMQEGECVAMVYDLAMVRAIVECRPRGTYTVEEIEIGRSTSKRKRPARKPLTNRPGAHRRRKSCKSPSPWIPDPPVAAIPPTRPQVR